MPLQWTDWLATGIRTIVGASFMGALPVIYLRLRSVCTIMAPKRNSGRFLCITDHAILVYQMGHAISFTQTDQTIQTLLKGVIVTDHDELLKASHTTNLIGEIHTAQFVHILCWLVEEGDVECRELFEQGKTDRQCGTHLLTTAELCKGTVHSLAAQDDLVVVLPRELCTAIAHNLTKNTIGFGRDIVEHGLQYLGSGLLDELAEIFQHGVQVFKRLVFLRCRRQFDPFVLVVIDLLFPLVDVQLVALEL